MSGISSNAMRLHGNGQADDIPRLELEDWATPNAFSQTPESIVGGRFEPKNELKSV